MTNGSFSYRINEIFYSLQGEGYHSGTPSVFVRFSGCNLRCPFCDTAHSDYEELTEAEIVRRVIAYPARHVVLTGGEPTLQITGSLCRALQHEGRFLAVETNGLRNLIAADCGQKPNVRLREAVDWITCSPKDGFCLPNENMPDSSAGKVVPLSEADELKVVFTDTSSEFLHRIEMLRKQFDARHYFLQPCSCGNTDEVVAYILRHPWWRLSLQTHKLIDIK